MLRKEPPAIVQIKLNSFHRKVLGGLSRQTDLTRSELIAMALEPFCQLHRDAAYEDVMEIDLSSPLRRGVQLGDSALVLGDSEIQTMANEA